MSTACGLPQGVGVSVLCGQGEGIKPYFLVDIINRWPLLC